MPEQTAERVQISGEELWAGRTWDLGHLRSTAADIIAFAQFVDPLPLHIDPQAASKGIFGGLVASGAQLYIEFHKRWFVPTWGSSVLCGLGIHNWNFFLPHLPDHDYRGQMQITSIQLHPEKRSAQIHWRYTFHDTADRLVQELEVRVIHRLDL